MILAKGTRVSSYDYHSVIKRSVIHTGHIPIIVLYYVNTEYYILGVW